MERNKRFQGSVAFLTGRLDTSGLELQWISDLVNTTRIYPYPEFYEPESGLFKDRDKKEARFVITADLLVAWICHLSHGARIRMEILEDEIVEALSRESVLAAATLTRCHMEASGWVVFGLEELTKAADTSDWSRLEILIPKMLNGAAVTKESKHAPEGSLDDLWVEPSSIMNAIDALDRYYGVCTGNKAHEARVLYAILSDYAHPSIFGLRHLFHGKENSDGWMISYTYEEKLSSKHYKMILQTLLLSMRLGHSAALMLRLGSVEDRGKDGLSYIKPSEKSCFEVWERILNGRPHRPN